MAVLCSGTSCRAAPEDARGLLRELERARPGRTFAPRLSIATKYSTCSTRPPAGGGTIPREACSSAEDAPSLPAAAFQAAAESSDPDSLHAVALERLIWSEDAGERFRRSILSLRKALRLTGRPAPVLADLSAAYLVRAERTQNPRDLVEALDAAQRALALEPHHEAGLFNRALALTLLAVDGEAARAWDAYLAVDSRSAWAKEARRRKGELPEPPPSPVEPVAGSSADEVEAFAARFPQEARLLGWDRLLGQWGDAFLGGDARRATGLLDLAGTLGDALARRGGDASLADAVRAIRAIAGDPGKTRTLARAHRAYAAGQKLFVGGDLGPAADTFAQIAAARPRSEPLVRWVEAFRGGAVASNGDLKTGGTLLRAVLADADSARHPALAARTRWMLGTTLLRGGHYEDAHAEFTRASGIFARLGEREYLGANQALAAEAAYEGGDTLAAYGWMHRALGTLRPYRASVRLHSLLVQVAHSAAADGMTQAAAAFHDEDVRVSALVDTPHHPVEARLTRARALAEAGQVDQAAREVEAVRPLVESLTVQVPRERFREQLRYVEAVVHMRTDPRGAAADLESAVNYFGGAGRSVPWLIPALTRRADARFALGEMNAAVADLDRVTTLFDSLTSRVSRAALRASMLEVARGGFDRLVMLKLAAGDTLGALAALERGRTGFAPGGRERIPEFAARPTAPPGQVAVEYALIGDTLLILTLSGNTVHLSRDVRDRDEFLRTVERARSNLERPDNAPAAALDLQRLYDWLVWPVEARLGASETPLVILADGEVAGVPFAALYDARRQRYLVQDRPLRFAANLRDATRPTARGAATRVSALLVADPAFDRLANPDLDPLPGARAEVDSVRTAYPGAVVLADTGATRPALEERVRRASILHYAGHAVFDDERPERSFLVLAGKNAAGRLTAEDAGALDLGGVRLVVLSACQTLPSREGRSGGFAGFSGALLAAGAGGVVGSLWRVDDRLTQRLMVAFHHEYQRSGNGALALRQAQLRLLYSGDPELNSPAAWAGFRYAGT